MGRVGKGQTCSVAGCTNRAERSLASSELSGLGMKISPVGRRAYLCSQHYKAWKKEVRKIREYERVRWEA